MTLLEPKSNFETPSYNSRASRARRVDLFEPRRDIVGMEQKSVEADPQSMKNK